MLLANVAHTWYARFVLELTAVVAVLVKEGTEDEEGPLLDCDVSLVETLWIHSSTMLSGSIGPSKVLRASQVRFNQNRVNSVSNSIWYQQLKIRTYKVSFSKLGPCADTTLASRLRLLTAPCLLNAWLAILLMCGLLLVQSTTTGPVTW